MSSELLLLPDDRRCSWWRRILIAEEFRRQLRLAFPMIVVNVSYNLITLISVMFAGREGTLMLAGATLASSWSFVTGFFFLLGLSGALETFCGQFYGSKAYRMLGLHLQASCVITVFVGSVIAAVWFYTEPILILFKQAPQIAGAASLYLKYLIPGLFGYGLFQNIIRFLQTQSSVNMLMAVSVASIPFHIALCYVLTVVSGLGFVGAPLAASISFCTSALLMMLHVVYSKQFEHTWTGLSLQSLDFIFPTLKLALPSAGMLCLECWAFEGLVLLAGLMPNSEVTTSLIAICVNTEALAFMATFGFSAAISTRVSNELGAGEPDLAKRAVAVTLALSLLSAVVIILALVFGHSLFAGLFTTNDEIKGAFGGMVPFLLTSITLDSFQGILSGIARGCGWQTIAVGANLASYYLIGLPVAVLCAFIFRLYTKGLWIGIMCGLFSQGSILVVLTLCLKWERKV